MAELVGIAGNVDARDPPIPEVEGGNLKHAAALLPGTFGRARSNTIVAAAPAGCAEARSPPVSWA